jgi:hypothetical protein
MAKFEKGHKPLGGRPPGSKNILTKTVKENLVAAFEGAGGLKEFIKWAKANPKEFYPLYVKLLPTELKGPGEDGRLVIEIVRLGDK